MIRHSAIDEDVAYEGDSYCEKTHDLRVRVVIDTVADA